MDRPHRPAPDVRAAITLAAACVLLIACGEAKWTLPSSDAELEAATRRGDSMAVQIAFERAIADTLARIAAGELDPSLITTLGSAAEASRSAAVAGSSADPMVGASGAAMTARAIARADSLIREEARRTLAATQRRATPLASEEGGTTPDMGIGRRTARDTLRGILTLEGAPPAVRVMLVTAAATWPVGLGGMAVSDLLRLDGLEAVVRGVRAGPGDFAVTSFSVRAIDGIPVVDGVLENEGGVWSVRGPDEERRMLPRVPTPLQAFVGSRVWVALEPGASPAFGVITPR